ncbi:MAG: quinone-dependent dihydroorotate dehydrogenase [Alphaproteobacteria bacterium]|nr:quinone-dependent dihydroorotate dehydrogenase [Alphaproteobacteria bacterium]
MSLFSRAATALLRTLPAEAAHNATIRLLASGMAPSADGTDAGSLETTVLGKAFPNPIGLAAGFDKNAEAYQASFGLGFGFVEVGTVTPRPQAGNPKPRLFRLTADRAVINRMGFNNGGLDALVRRVEADPPRGILGINLGKNKDSEDAVADYVTGVERTAHLAGYLVINVSSPNTPGLRDLQRREPLIQLATAVKEARDRTVAKHPPPLLLKVAPDLTEQQIGDIAAVATYGLVDGLIVSNTTISRPEGLRGPSAEAGGLSGEPLFDLSTQVLKNFRRQTGGKVPLIGVGGVASGAQAYAKIKAGASLVQLYTGLVYGGPGLVGEIKRDLATLLARDGHSTVAEAVGTE